MYIVRLEHKKGRVRFKHVAERFKFIATWWKFVACLLSVTIFNLFEFGLDCCPYNFILFACAAYQSREYMGNNQSINTYHTLVY